MKELNFAKEKLVYDFFFFLIISIQIFLSSKYVYRIKFYEKDIS